MGGFAVIGLQMVAKGGYLEVVEELVLELGWDMVKNERGVEMIEGAGVGVVEAELVIGGRMGGIR